MDRSLHPIILMFLLVLLNAPFVGVVAQDGAEVNVDTIIKYAVSTETKKLCEQHEYQSEECKRYLTNVEEIVQYQESLNYFRILNERDEVLSEYLAFGYFDKKYCGEYLRYHKNGMLRVEGSYGCKSPKNYNKCNLKEGVWKYYSDTGRLVKTETYDKGKLVATRKF